MTDPLPDGVSIPVENRLERAVVHLRVPIKHGDRVLETLELARLKGAHVRQAPADWRDVGSVLEFVGVLTGLPPSSLDQLVGEALGDVVRAAYQVSWPLLDLPMQWEAVWEHQRTELAGKEEAKTIPKMPAFPGGYVLALAEPVVLEKDTTTELRFSEMTGRVARRCPIDGVPVSKLPWLVCELTGASRATVDELHGRDLNRALALAQLFFFAIRGTTGTSG